MELPQVEERSNIPEVIKTARVYKITCKTNGKIYVGKTVKPIEG
jgi:hypothetical protein